MTTSSAPQLHPGEPGYLLGVLSEISASTLDDKAAILDAKRRLIAAINVTELIIPTADDGLPLGLSGGTKDLLVTFTDDEAARAYFEARGLEPGVQRTVTGAPADSRDVVINPAGPFGILIDPGDFDRYRPRRFLTKSPGPVVKPGLASPDARPSARIASREYIERLGRAVQAEDWDECARLAGPADEINPIGSLEYIAAAQQLAGVKNLRRDEPRAGLRQLVWGVVHFAAYGFPERAVDATLNNAELLLDTARSGLTEPDWARGQVGALVELLELLNLDRRREETETFIMAFRDLTVVDGD